MSEELENVLHNEVHTSYVAYAVKQKMLSIRNPSRIFGPETFDQVRNNLLDSV